MSRIAARTRFHTLSPSKSPSASNASTRIAARTEASSQNCSIMACAVRQISRSESTRPPIQLDPFRTDRIIGTKWERGKPRRAPPLYEFTVADMEPDHRVIVTCTCGHKGFLTKEELLNHPRIEPFCKIVGLIFHIRCSMCRKKGRAEITLTRFAPW
jgi:hypothetical protein